MNGSMFSSSLRRVAAVAKKEFGSSMASPSAWVFLVIFIVMNGLCTFVFNDLLAAGQADLAIFFNWMPWLFLFVVPALGMPLWAEERRTGTFELSLSYPATLWELVLGKYAAGMMLLLTSLVLTLPIPLTIYLLGKPDTGAILCGYFGAVMIGSAFLAVSGLCSAMTKSQTASFLLSLTSCGFLLFTGWDRVTGILTEYLPDWLLRLISYITIIPHYQAFQRGLLDTSELIYCISITLLFLYATKSVLSFSAAGTGNIFAPGALRDPYTWKKLLTTVIGIVIGFYAFFCVSYAAGTFRIRFDCTSDRAYSLMPLTRELAAKITKPVELRLYVSPENSALPAGHRQYAERIKWLLTTLSGASNGMITFTEITPEPDSMEEEAALVDGVKPAQNQTGDRFFLGLSVSCRQKSAAIPFLFPQQEHLLEYEVIRAIRSVTEQRRKNVGLMSEFPLLGRAPNPQHGISAFAPWYIFRDLSNDYQFYDVPLEITEIPPEIETLIVVHPVSIGKRGQYAIDQYLRRGGKVMIFLDPRHAFALANARRDSSMIRKITSSLPLLTEAWGIHYDPEQMAADLNFKYDRIGASGVRQTVPSALFITEEGINRTDSQTKALHLLRMNYTAVFTVDSPRKGLTYEELVTTSRDAKPVPVESLQDKVFAEFQPGQGHRYPLALRITGVFPTAFPDGLTSVKGAETKEAAPEEVKPGEVILFGDADMLFHDACIQQSHDEFGQQLLLRNSDNVALVQNLLDELTGTERLAPLRSRIPMNRPLTVIEESRKKAELQYRDRILALMGDYARQQKQVDLLRRYIIANPGRLNLTPQQQQLLDSANRREAEFKREINAYRTLLRTELDDISRKVRIWNIIYIPLGVVGLGIAWSVLRRVRWRKTKK